MTRVIDIRKMLWKRFQERERRALAFDALLLQMDATPNKGDTVRFNRPTEYRKLKAV